MVLTSETMEQVEKLTSELRAIIHWDAEYWRRACPEWYETVAFMSRQRRRIEIIRDLSSAAKRGSVPAIVEGKQSTRSQFPLKGKKRRFKYAEDLAS